MSRIAVILFNLGGPDSLKAVRPFLRNLFDDKAIIGLPQPLRRLLAETISRTREKSAAQGYARMGGRSPIQPETEAQAAALKDALARLHPGDEFKIFIAMRYWRPRAKETLAKVKAFAPDKVILAPLYPQFSTTTTGSSLAEWRRLGGPGEAICCWPVDQGLVAAHARHIRETWEKAGRPKARLLFSAHGLPQSVIDRGDPYQAQIERTCAAIAGALGEGWDWRICYQSRVGPMKWLEPTTDAEIRAAAADGVSVLIDPVAFVSEHIETLVELDHDYAQIAGELGMTAYLRAPAAGCAPEFIGGLARAILARLDGANPGSACGKLCGRSL